MYFRNWKHNSPILTAVKNNIVLIQMLLQFSNFRSFKETGPASSVGCVSTW